MAAISFSTFKESCEERDYEPRSHEEKSLYVFSKNGIKCEIKKNNYTVGWEAKPEYIAEIRKHLIEAGFTEKLGKRAEKRKDEKDYMHVPFDGDVLENFWIIVAIIESIESIVKKIRGQAIKPIPREIGERNIFEKIAKRFKFYLDSDDSFALDKWRDQLEGDSIDYLITVGESVKRTKENTYREHIVPCVMIYNQIIIMLQEKRSVTEVAQMIKNNLAIVLITNQEADLLDGELDMQTSMPEGWNFGDSVFARLETAGIKLK